jgi:hypothetical protein
MTISPYHLLENTPLKISEYRFNYVSLRRVICEDKNVSSFNLVVDNESFLYLKNTHLPKSNLFFINGNPDTELTVIVPISNNQIQYEIKNVVSSKKDVNTVFLTSVYYVQQSLLNQPPS